MPAAPRALLAAAAALPWALPWTARAAGPPCAVSDKGYVDPNVTVVNGGISNADAQACQDLCVALVTCRVFTFYINSGGCWLQGLDGVVPPLQAIPGVWSGPRQCPAGTGVLDVDGSGPSAAKAEEEVSSEAARAGAAAAGVGAGGDGAGGSGTGAFLGAPRWLWLFMLATIAISIVSCCFFFSGSDEVKERKRRKAREDNSSVKLMAADDASQGAKAAPAVQAPLALSARPVPTQAAPMPSYAPAPVPSGMATGPLLAQARPAPLASAAPVAYSAPVAYQAVRGPPPPQSLFDRLDANHDGVLTREELNAAMRPK